MRTGSLPSKVDLPGHASTSSRCTSGRTARYVICIPSPMHIAHENIGLRVSAAPGDAEVPPSRPRRIVGRRGHRLVFLDIDEVWAIEAQDRLTFVHAVWGRFDLDVSLAAIQL